MPERVVPVPTALIVPGVILVAAGLWDLRTREIPHGFPLVLLAWAVGSRAFGFQPARWGSFALGAGLGLCVGLVGFRLRQLGGGDAKLFVGLGGVLGPIGLFIALAWIALVGGAWGVLARARGVEEIVFGPAIALGYLLAVIVT